MRRLLYKFCNIHPAESRATASLRPNIPRICPCCKYLSDFCSSHCFPLLLLRKNALRRLRVQHGFDWTIPTNATQVLHGRTPHHYKIATYGYSFLSICTLLITNRRHHRRHFHCPCSHHFPNFPDSYSRSYLPQHHQLLSPFPKPQRPTTSSPDPPS